MKPTNGRYRFHVNERGPLPPGGGVGPIIRTFDVQYDVDDAGVHVLPHPAMPYDSEGDCFLQGSVSLRCTGAGTFIGTDGTKNFDGTCEKLSDLPPPLPPP